MDLRFEIELIIAYIADIVFYAIQKTLPSLPYLIVCRRHSILDLVSTVS